ncbi:IS66 family insertion sequence element accessory protein TnpB [Bradyrhizobium australafricanum]|uniref:IS66 family insertion sequence element accessory protein TnpB n=1 Tax=Bradyrhizobium australafricanum TaxID=2821406 RepID=UPI00201BF366|nr:IS66 family insertion sequence element accessory protein TnpB [Bradyrhizobium australafricanum]
MDGLAAQVQNVLAADPFSGALFVFRGKRGDMLKILAWDGSGLCLFTPPSASVEGFSTSDVVRAAARSTRRFHRLHCLRGRFDVGISYRQ